MIERFSGAVAAASLAAGLTAGCGYGDIHRLPPNNTLERVAHNAGYTKEIGRLPLRQHISTMTAGGDMVHVYNFTNQAISEQVVAEDIAAYDAVAQDVLTQDVQIYPGYTESNPVTVQTVAEPRHEEHNLLLLPLDAPTPPIYADRDSTKQTGRAETKHFSDVRQGLSIVYPGDNETPLDSQIAGMDVELCQSMLAIRVTSDNLPRTPGEDPVIDQMDGELKAKEAVCNELGDAVTAQRNGMSYEQLAKYQIDLGTTIIGNFYMPPQAIPKEIFDKVGRVVKAGNYHTTVPQPQQP